MLPVNDVGSVLCLSIPSKDDLKDSVFSYLRHHSVMWSAYDSELQLAFLPLGATAQGEL
jgi:hypothetical protein